MDLMQAASKQPQEYRISLLYVRMAIQRASYLRNTRASALSSPYAPLKGRGADLLHGECIISPRS